MKKGYGIEKYAGAYYGSTSTQDSPTMPDLDKFRVDLSKYVPEFLYNEKTLNKIYKSQEEQLAVALWQSDESDDPACRERRKSAGPPPAGSSP